MPRNLFAGPITEWSTMMKRIRQGFTLIEMVLVLAVAATILTLGYQQYQRMNLNKRVFALKGPVLQAKQVVQNYYNDNCNDLVSDFVASNLGGSGISTSGLNLRYNQNNTVPNANFGSINLPFTLPSTISKPWLAEVKSEQSNITLYLTLWVPYTDTPTLDAIQKELNATSYGTVYPNGSSVSQGRLFIWFWPATGEATAVSHQRMGYDAAANAGYVKANTPSFAALSKIGGPVSVNKMSCQTVPAWLQAANTYLGK